MPRTTIARRSRTPVPPVPATRKLAALALLFAPAVHSAEWKVAPSLTLEETYTDNVRLTPLGTEQSDMVTQVSPAIAVSTTGRNLTLKANYIMQNFAYARATSRIVTNHLLAANAHAELLPELFFLDGLASISQQAISPFGPVSNSTLNLSDNRAEVRTYRLSPYLRYRFGQVADAELRYSRDSVSSSSGSLLGTDTDRILFALNNGAMLRTWGWGFQFNSQKIDYSNANTVRFESSTGNLFYRLTPRFRLNLKAGYENNSYFSTGEQPKGAFASAGFTWSPMERASIEASAGKRFYGTTYALQANVRSHRMAWALGYNEDLTTTQSQFLVPVTVDTSAFLNQLWKSSIPDPDARQKVVDAFIRDTGISGSLTQAVNAFTNRVFLQKSLHGSLALTGVRSTALISLFDIRREAQTPGAIDNALTGAPGGMFDDSTRQRGANAVWNLRVTPRTNVALTGTISRVTGLTSGREDHNRIARLSLSRQLQPKLKGTIELRRLRQTSSLAGSDVRENAINASLLLVF